jgi:hypothetical protein
MKTVYMYRRLVVFSGYSIRKRPTEKGQVKIHTALFTEKIEAHEPHSKQGRILNS